MIILLDGVEGGGGWPTQNIRDNNSDAGSKRSEPLFVFLIQQTG